jgi:site-specific recombinase XerD
MAELADAEDLKSSGAILVGSSPSPGTRHKKSNISSNSLNSSEVVLSKLLSNFLNSRRQGLSSLTIEFYREYLYRAKVAVGLHITNQQIKVFLKSLHCSDGGKHAYYRALKVFYNWLYSVNSGYGLRASDNPMLGLDAPKEERKILPSLTARQVDDAIDKAGCIRDKAIVSLFADTGLRLSELTTINPANIDWEHRVIKVTCKGNKEGLALFGERTERLLKLWMLEYRANGRLWDVGMWGIEDMLERLSNKTGIAFTAHTFRRTFASILAKRGVDSLHIMRLGRWESMAMVEHYTRSVRFEDSMKFYTAIVS